MMMTSNPRLITYEVLRLFETDLYPFVIVGGILTPIWNDFFFLFFIMRIFYRKSTRILTHKKSIDKFNIYCDW